MYLSGNQLLYYREKWEQVKTIKLLVAYLVLNTAIIVGMMMAPPIIARAIKALSFPYSSPILLINAILLFMIIGKQKIQSKFINYIATSSLAIYILHGNRPYVPIIHGLVCGYFQSLTSNVLVLLVLYMGYTLIIIAICIFVDKLLTPLWNLLTLISQKVYIKLGY